MFLEEKRSIIEEEGVPVVVSDYTGNIIYGTWALIGKVSKQSFSEISHEHHRKGHFLPELDIKNGLIVTNNLTKERYLVLTNMIEAYGTEVISTICRLASTNAELEVVGMVETADENGDISAGEEVKATGLPVYIQLVNAEMKQYQPGQLEKTRFFIYAPPIDFKMADKLQVSMGERVTKVKLQHVDYFTYNGLALLYVETETRS